MLILQHLLYGKQNELKAFSDLILRKCNKRYYIGLNVARYCYTSSY